MADILTNLGEAHVVDQLDGGGATSEYVGMGEGSTAPTKGDTDLDTASNESRVVGVRTQPSADVVQWVAEITATGTRAIVECGLFDAAGSGNPPTGGNILSRHTFSVINVVSSDTIEFTVQWEVT
jgi:hypothetical protein